MIQKSAFHSINPSHFPVSEDNSCTISQLDLASLDSLRAQFREIKRRYLAKRSEIIDKLARGAEVEPGPYQAFLRISARLSIE